MGVLTLPDPLEVYAGDAWSQSFEFGEDDGSGFVAEDLSSWGDWSAQWRPTDASTTAIDLTVDTTQLVDGIVTVSASESQTRAMGVNGVFDVQAADPRVRTFVRAKTKWRRDVTRD